VELRKFFVGIVVPVVVVIVIFDDVVNDFITLYFTMTCWLC
jgi:hypothetical protein